MNDTAAAYHAANAAYTAAAYNLYNADDAAVDAAMDAANAAYAVMLAARDAMWAAQDAAINALPAAAPAPRTIDTAAVATLRQYALDNYEAGGHWVYETHDAADYQEYLDEAAGDISKAKVLVRHLWELTASVGNDIANS